MSIVSKSTVVSVSAAEEEEAKDEPEEEAKSNQEEEEEQQQQPEEEAKSNDDEEVGNNNDGDSPSQDSPSQDSPSQDSGISTENQDNPGVAPPSSTDETNLAPDSSAKEDISTGTPNNVDQELNDPTNPSTELSCEDGIQSDENNCDEAPITT